MTYRLSRVLLALAAALTLGVLSGCECASTPTLQHVDACGTDGGASDAGTGTMDAGARGDGGDGGAMADANHDAGVDGDVGAMPDSAGAGLQCSACTTDSDCSTNGQAYCVMLASTGQRACMLTCNTEIPSCPARFDCLNSVLSPTPGPVCQPVGERCCVDPDNDGYGQGIGCRGTDCNEMDAMIYMGAPERCNGLDDNCNGQIDEGNPGGGMVCTTGMSGACSAGATACVGGNVVCRANASSTMETCNGQDDDCDGMVDEDDTNAMHHILTQSCYDGPAGTSGHGTCAPGVQTCTGGSYGSCIGEALPGVETCNGTDDDCNGVVDNGDPGGGISCSSSSPGVCLAGTTHCRAGAVACVPNVAPGAMTEACNNLDDDCNGVIDDPYRSMLNMVCTAGVGACQRAGITICNSTMNGVSCNATPGTATAESCNGIDDDCNGTVDDPYRSMLNTTCTTGVGACLRAGVQVCNATGSGTMCNATAGTATAEQCNSIDDDCNGTIDDPWRATLGTVCTAGVGACLRSGVQVCNATMNGTSCNATPGSPSSELCNNVDDNCNNMTDEGFAWSMDPANPGVSYSLGSACANGLGACRRGGVVVCAASQTSATCNAVVGASTAETCNYVDDNCNGIVDDGFVNGSGVYSANTACGACGIDCTMIYSGATHANAFGTCSVSGTTASCVMNCNAGTFNLNGVPNDGCEFTLDANAIYVSGAAGGGGVNDGTCGGGPVGTGSTFGGVANHPCATILYAQGRAAGVVPVRTRILVADGLYTENVNLVNGQSLMGGYRADTWERHLTTTLTTIRGVSGAGNMHTITGNGIMSGLVEGFVIQGVDASSSGANSYAVYLNGSNNGLIIRSNVIYAGNGAPGLPGAAGIDGANGVNGTAGANALDEGGACTTSITGPAGGMRSCGGTSVSGGAGGSATCTPIFNRIVSSHVGVAGSGPGFGAGGTAAYDSELINNGGTCNFCGVPGTNPYNGGNGADGTTGANGAAGTGASSTVGSVPAADWIGASGNNGTGGVNGGGGGGGAAGGGAQAALGCTDYQLGSTGGGGGSGGCAGTFGSGGGAGGGSFAIFIVNTASYPVLTGNTIYLGFGGAAGTGGRAGSGGVRGSGAVAGTLVGLFCPGVGGTGGNGGNGGHGGGGGGGAGGVSYGIYTSGTTGYGAGNNFQASGGGGAAGGGGPSIGNPGTPGVAGASGNTN
jgi:hypothetical protein